MIDLPAAVIPDEEVDEGLDKLRVYVEHVGREILVEAQPGDNVDSNPRENAVLFAL